MFGRRKKSVESKKQKIIRKNYDGNFEKFRKQLSTTSSGKTFEALYGKFVQFISPARKSGPVFFSPITLLRVVQMLRFRFYDSAFSIDSQKGFFFLIYVKTGQHTTKNRVNIRTRHYNSHVTYHTFSRFL